MDAPILLLVGLALAILAGVPLTVYAYGLRLRRDLRDMVETHTHRNAAGPAVEGAADAEDWKAGEHSHVFGSAPFHQDSTSKSYRCEVHGCERIHTQSLR